MKISYLIGFVICFLTIGQTRGQNYGYSLNPGWKSYLGHQVDSQLSVIGLGSHMPTSSRAHFLVKTIYGSDFEQIRSDSFFAPPDSSWTYSINSSHAVEFDGDKVVIGGIRFKNDAADSLLPLIFELQDSSLSTIPLDNIGAKTFIFDIEQGQDSILILGGIQKELIEGSERHIALFDGSSTLLTTSCSQIEQEFDCYIYPRRVFSIGSQKLLLGETVSRYDQDIRNAIMVLYDSLGRKTWEMNLGNDSTGITALVAEKLGDGRLLLLYTNRWWKPFQEPPDFNNRYSSPIDTVGLYVKIVELNSGISEEYSLYDRLQSVGNTTFKNSSSHYAAPTADGGVVVVGETLDDGEKGFFAKFSPSGKFEWYRIIEIDESPDSREDLSLWGVSEVEEGFLLYGSLLIYPGSKYPNGAHRGITIRTDKHGCMTKGCELSSGPIIHKPEYSVSISPNPVIDHFTVNSGDRSRELFDFSIVGMDGRTVLDSRARFGSKFEIDLWPGFYALVIDDPKWGVISKKLVVLKR